VTRFRFVEREAAQFPVSLLCRVVGVTRQGFYPWKRRPPSARELADRKLAERIRAIHLETEEIYGAANPVRASICRPRSKEASSLPFVALHLT
jgi:hypothetical protein